MGVDAPAGFSALGTRAVRQVVVRGGDPIVRTEPATTEVVRGAGSGSVDFVR